MKNKILIALFTILTFGLFLIPISFAKDFSSKDLDNINRIDYINTKNYNTSYRYIDLHFNKDNLTSTTSYYFTLQVFSVNDLTTPLLPSTLFSNYYLYDNNINTISIQENGSYYALRTTSSSNGSVWFSGNYKDSYIRLQTSTFDTSFLDRYVFNICLTRSSTGYINYFVPNSFYNIDLTNDKGVFQNVKASLQMVGASAVDYTNTIVKYNKIGLFDGLADMVFSSNNVSASYDYVMILDFGEGAFIKDLPNLSIKYLEINSITINNQYYTYDNAKSAYSWLNRNIYLYNDSATLFVNDNDGIDNPNTFINRIQFRLPDYDFKSSTYYNSSYGLLNYLKTCGLSALSVSSSDAYEKGVEVGVQTGYNNGFLDGYNQAVNENTGGFDNLFFSVANVPMHIISSVLNFEILGFNLLGFFTGIITLMLFVHFIRKFKE